MNFYNTKKWKDIVLPVFDEEGYIEELIPINSKNKTFNWDYQKQDYYINYESQKYYSGEFIHFVLNPDEIEFYRGRGYRVDLKSIKRYAFNERGALIKNKIINIDGVIE